MRCICQAESGCHPPYRGCDNDEEPCGPFQVTKSTWFDALQDPTQEIEDVSFKECASTYQCSAKVVRGYVSHHATGPAVSGEFATCQQATTVFGSGQGRGSDGARVLWAQVQICLRAQ
ncbi:lysozyme-like [Diadema antillarum]|uniref:lysozyme-like n=1 Tax=Diadema antillarum TaxID=105358 RepID=UPI003A8A5211